MMRNSRQLRIDESNVGLEGQNAEYALEFVGDDGRISGVFGVAHAAHSKHRDESGRRVRAAEVNDFAGAYHHRTILFWFI